MSASSMGSTCYQIIKESEFETSVENHAFLCLRLFRFYACHVYSSFSFFLISSSNNTDPMRRCGAFSYVHVCSHFFLLLIQRQMSFHRRLSPSLPHPSKHKPRTGRVFSLNLNRKKSRLSCLTISILPEY